MHKFSVPSPNKRIKRSHREPVISRHIGRIFPDLKGIRKRKFKGILYRGTRRPGHTFEKWELQLGFMSPSDPD
jgi:hypothetical protein